MAPNIGGQTHSLAISHNNRWVASDAGHNGKIHVWDIASGELIRVLGAPTGDRLAFSPDNRQLAAGSQFGKVTLWKRLERLQ